jgi:hypothetical protein
MLVCSSIVPCIYFLSIFDYNSILSNMKHLTAETQDVDFPATMYMFAPVGQLSRSYGSASTNQICSISLPQTHFNLVRCEISKRRKDLSPHLDPQSSTHE